MIELNVANMMSDALGKKGITDGQVEELKDVIAAAHEKISSRKMPGLSFIDLKDQDTSGIKEAARAVREDSENFLLLGIGGSALGPRTILEALSPMHNLFKKPKVFILDNVDPMTLHNILSLIEPEKTSVNVVTKSGSTAETMASFMVFHEMVGSERIVATTDPEKGSLRKIASLEGMRALSIPPGVGGRYSVLSPVGLLLSEVIGADSNELLNGARDMHERCSRPEVWKNPAYLFGALLYLMEMDQERDVTVLMPYSDRLKPLSEWFCQLWAESLGKQGIGMTPYPSLGAVDQHSQLQLWMEGPEDKVVVFITVAAHGADIKIPETFAETETGFLGGRSLSELIGAEEESTELCLAKAGRPNMTLTVPAVDGYHLGQLFHFFEMAVVFVGFLYDIDPFDQPSVEMGKNFTYGMMGKKGFEKMKREVEEARQKKTRWMVA